MGGGLPMEENQISFEYPDLGAFSTIVIEMGNQILYTGDISLLTLFHPLIEGGSAGGSTQLC